MDHVTGTVVITVITNTILTPARTYAAGEFTCVPNLQTSILPPAGSKVFAVDLQKTSGPLLRDIIVSAPSTVTIPCEYTFVATHFGIKSNDSNTSQSSQSSHGTAANSTAPPSSTDTPLYDAGGLSSTRIAGLVIGCVVGGLFFTILIISIVLYKRRHHDEQNDSREPPDHSTMPASPRTSRRRRRHVAHSSTIPARPQTRAPTLALPSLFHYFGSNETATDKTIGPATAAVGEPAPPAPGSRRHSLSYYLLDGAGDSEIRSELSSAGFLLKGYVEMAYQHQPPHTISVGTVEKYLLELGLPKATRQSLANHALSDDGRTRCAAIRSVLAFVIFSALEMNSPTSDNSNHPPSLLPQVVTNLAGAPPSGTMGSPSTGSEWQDLKAINTWRRTTAYLLHPDKQSRTPLPLPNTAGFHEQVASLKGFLWSFLSLFVDNANDLNRRHAVDNRGLDKVIRACADVGYKLFSHPCEWRYLFMTDSVVGGSMSEIVVMPGLERVSGPDGEPYAAGGQVVSSPSTEKVKG